jgi:hypothetical protein
MNLTDTHCRRHAKFLDVKSSIKMRCSVIHVLVSDACATKSCRNVDISFDMSPSVCNNSKTAKVILINFDNWEVSLKFVSTFQFSLSDNNGHFT